MSQSELQSQSQTEAVGTTDWSNFPATKSCMFYKLMVASILQHKKLKIPEKFVKKYGDELSSFATVTIPNGRTWLVELEKVKGKIWFHNGWHEFVEFYSIRVGYFLVFRYEGKSNFFVHIFDLTVSEIKYPCSTFGRLQETSSQCLATHKNDVENNDIEEILVSGTTFPVPISSVFYECVNCNRNVTGNYGTSVKKLYRGSDEGNLGDQFQSFQNTGIRFSESEVNEVGSVISDEAEGRSRRRKRRTETKLVIKQKPKAKSTRAETISKTFTRRWRAVTTEEKQRTIRAADMFRPNNPYFKVVLRPSYVYRGFLLHIPALFSQKYLYRYTGLLTLQVSDGKQWRVGCCYRDGAAKLNKGWTEFVWGNNLEEGDVCVFELINSKDILLKVTIFRVLEDAAAVNQIMKVEPGTI